MLPILNSDKTTKRPVNRQRREEPLTTQNQNETGQVTSPIFQSAEKIVSATTETASETTNVSTLKISTKKPKKKLDFEVLLGFKVSEKIEKSFEKYMNDIESGGPCLKNNLLSLFDVDDGRDKMDFSNVSEAEILQKVADALQKA